MNTYLLKFLIFWSNLGRNGVIMGYSSQTLLSILFYLEFKRYFFLFLETGYTVHAYMLNSLDAFLLTLLPIVIINL